MKIIKPTTISDAVMTASNVPENDHAEWLLSGTYALGDRVIVTSVHSVYESLTSSNTGNNPTTDTTNWVRVGATNRWKPFDLTLNDPTVAATPITYQLTPTEIVNALVFFGLNADTVQVVVTDVTEGVVYDKTQSLNDNSAVSDWYTYFFEPIITGTKLVLTDLPAYAAAVIDITIAALSGNVEVSEIVAGRVQELGIALNGTRIGIQDFSRKDRDAFGNANIVVRAFADTVDFRFVLDTARAGQVRDRLAQLRASPTVFFGAEGQNNFGTLVYGYFRDFDIDLSTTRKSFCNLTVEGLI